MKEVSLAKAYDPALVESQWYKVWEEQGYFHASATTPKTPFTIVIPPPNVTGSLHMGHAMYVVQDVLTRWRRMQGYNALWLPGTDHAGIATQLVVERMLAKEEGKSRHDLGRDEFTARVWQWKEKYGSRIIEQLRVLGFSLDWQRCRFTMDEGLSRAVIEAFVRLHEDGLIYRARRLINWCTRCYTALSDLEVEAEETDGKLWHIAYPVVGADERLVVATTRPETLLGDTAVAVHPEDPRFAHLIGKQVQVPLTDRTIPVIADPVLVSMEFGTGAVKVTPGHDFNDFETGVRHSLPQISVFDLAGKLNENAPERFRGLTIADSRKAVLEALTEAGLLVEEKAHKLNLGRCQRCDTVIEPMLSLQWFVKTEPLAKPAIEAVEQGKTRFVPEHYTDDYFRWMRNIRDWCISRQLWWGHRIPAWYDPQGNVFVARTFEEACQRAGRTDLTQDDDVLDTWFSSALWPFSTLGWPDQTRDLKTFYPTSVMETGHDILFFWVARMMMMGLHFMKKVPFRTVLLHALVVDENGEKMSKVKGNVLDPLHLVYGAKLEEVVGFPKDKTPSKKELDEGLAKFKKAFPSAAAAYPGGFPRQGADALRFFLLVMGAQGRNIRLSVPRIDGYRHFLNKIWSATRFFLMNVEDSEMESLAGFRESLLHQRGVLESESPQHTAPIVLGLGERYILSRLTHVTEEVDAAFAASKFSDGAQALYRFFWTELCDWYIEISKPALSPQATPAQRLAALGTLTMCLETSLRLLHPIIPFITEELWLRLPRPSGSPQSIMITLYPTGDAALKDAPAERNMGIVQTAIQAMRTIKSTYNLKAQKAEEDAVPTRVQFAVKCADAESRKVLLENQATIELLTRAELHQVVEEVASQKGTIAEVVPGMTVLLLHADTLIDAQAELGRLDKEAQKVDKELQTVKGRLQNADFVARAKPEVVEQNRARIEELTQRLAELHQHKTAIAAMTH
ncbi:MAG: valine--tRNA ligase [Myxococcales bacterium]|nr:valine--tRNA ligase [Myxococcales bacterium]